jgi:Sugar (and other) transporter
VLITTAIFVGNAGTFFLFGSLSVVALAYFQRQVPETKNRSLEEIERVLGLPGAAHAGQRCGLTATRIRAHGPAAPSGGGCPPGKVS